MLKRLSSKTRLKAETECKKMVNSTSRGGGGGFLVPQKNRGWASERKRSSGQGGPWICMQNPSQIGEMRASVYTVTRQDKHQAESTELLNQDTRALDAQNGSSLGENVAKKCGLSGDSGDHLRAWRIWHSRSPAP